MNFKLWIEQRRQVLAGSCVAVELALLFTLHLVDLGQPVHESRR